MSRARFSRRVANPRVCLSESDGSGELESQLPLLKIAVDEILNRIIERWVIPARIEQILAESAPTIPRDRIELRSQEALCCDHLQLAQLDLHLLTLDLNSTGGCFALNLVPVENDLDCAMVRSRDESVFRR